MDKVRKVVISLVAALACLVGMSGCYEHQYVAQYHHHTRDWYDRHEVLPGVRYGDPEAKKAKPMRQKNTEVSNSAASSRSRE